MKRNQRRSSRRSGSGGDGVDFNKDNKICLSLFGMPPIPLGDATPQYCEGKVGSSGLT